MRLSVPRYHSRGDFDHLAMALGRWIGRAYWLARRRCSRYSIGRLMPLTLLASLWGHGVLSGIGLRFPDSLQRRTCAGSTLGLSITGRVFTVVTGPPIFQPAADSHEVFVPCGVTWPRRALRGCRPPENSASALSNVASPTMLTASFDSPLRFFLPCAGITFDPVIDAVRFAFSPALRGQTKDALGLIAAWPGGLVELPAALLGLAALRSFDPMDDCGGCSLAAIPHAISPLFRARRELSF